MSTEAIIHLAQTVIMGTVGAIVVLLKWGVRGGSALAGYQDLGRRVTALETRYQEDKVEVKEWRRDIGQKMSDIGSDVQAMPETLRKTFLTIELADRDRRESEHDRTRLWEALQRDPRARTRSGE